MVFLCHFEEKCLPECPVDIFTECLKGYVDGIFVTFDSYMQLLKFLDYMNHQHPNIKFTFEHEKNNKLSILDVTICKENN